MRSVIRSPLMAFSLVLVSAFPVPAQEPVKPPVFRSKTELVLVDFVVSDKADRPVGGLSAKDFVVKEDGKERPIVSFEAFAGDEPSSAPASPAPDTPLVPDPARAPSSSPGRSAGAATVLLIDDGQLTQEQAVRLRPGLKTLLARIGERSGSVALVAPASRISVATKLPGGAVDLAAAVDQIGGRRIEDHSSFPLSDSEAIAAARGDATMLARVAARFAALNPQLSAEQAAMLAHNRSTEVAYDARMRRESMYGVALLAFDWLAGQPGRHSLVLVSGGFVREPADSKYYELVTRSLRVNAPIHFLDVRGLQGVGLEGVQYGPALNWNASTTPFTWADDAQGSSGLADDTGGIAIRNTNDLGKGLGRVFDTMQTYYVLAYEPPANAKPGFRKIQVEVRTKGLHVRARRGYFVAAAASRHASAGAPH
jgi:VWFA-related protein